jgi:hypothetical protein
MIASDCLTCCCCNVLKDFSCIGVILNLLLKEFEKFSVSLNFISTIQLLNYSYDRSHDVFSLVISENVGNILLELFRE